MVSMAKPVLSLTVRGALRPSRSIFSASKIFTISKNGRPLSLKYACRKMGIASYTIKRFAPELYEKWKDLDFHTGLFFFAGHGVQVKGCNYLIPVDANLKTEKWWNMIVLKQIGFYDIWKMANQQ
jgi:hypothetical protein